MEIICPFGVMAYAAIALLWFAMGLGNTRYNHMALQDMPEAIRTGSDEEFSKVTHLITSSVFWPAAITYTLVVDVLVPLVRVAGAIMGRLLSTWR